MKYTIENFKDVVEDTAMKDKEKIDELLRIDAIIYCNMGLDSRQKERDEATRLSKKIYTEIKKIDNEMGETFIRLIDKKIKT
tara:strand:- start:4991 stop:5236 length:246 start_codon:yes stop_codon:yes gene_type:complete